MDVGGTKTHASSAFLDRKFPSDLAALPAKLRALTRATPKVDTLIIGMRGVWLASEKKAWKTNLAKVAKNVQVFSDIELAHRWAFGTEPGILVNAGTGSIAFGRNLAGKTARAGDSEHCLETKAPDFGSDARGLNILMRKGSGSGRVLTRNARTRCARSPRWQKELFNALTSNRGPWSDELWMSRPRT